MENLNRDCYQIVTNEISLLASSACVCFRVYDDFIASEREHFFAHLLLHHHYALML